MLTSNSNSHKESLSQKLGHFYSQPNAHLEGNSFDASHLSAFILNSKFSQPVFSHKPIIGTAAGISGSYQSHNSNISSMNSFNDKPSFVFISQDRSRNMIDFPSNYSNLNPLVLPDLKNKGHIFEIDKLKEKEQKTRRDRLIKNAYKSGILNIDNPLNDESRVYHQEHEIFKKREEYLTISKDRQAKMIAKYSNTNPTIEFFNKRHSLGVLTKEKEKIEKITPNWTRKAHPTEDFLERRKDTHTRVFSVEPGNYNLQRAMFLREKDVGKKDYTLINETPNKLELRHREIMKVLG
jgi:hypothetical protein